MTSYRLAPEWVRQDAVILVWPSRHSDWALDINHYKLFKAIEQTYLELTYYLSQHQRVLLIIHNQEHQSHIETLLSTKNSKFNNIEFIQIPTDDTWVRDYGPIAVYSDPEKYKLFDFNFDAWGEKYSYIKDNAFNKQLVSALEIESIYEKINFTLEAGNLEINNKGALLLSSNCLNRNTETIPQDLAALEEQLYNWFSCTKVQWIHDVILMGDDTDGHIDNLVRYCDDDVMVYSAVGHSSDPNRDTLELLAKQMNTIAIENTAEIIPLPLPNPIIVNNSQLPASYINFLISNENVFVPVFNDQHDDHALKMIDDCFPTKEIIDIESNALIQQYGGIHCASMQIPAGCLI